MLVYAFLFAPIVVLVVFSFNKARSGTSWTGFSTQWYSKLLTTTMRSGVRNTLKVGVTQRLVATVLGTLAAFALTRFKFRGRSGYSTLVFVSLVMPEVVMGIALLAFFVEFAGWHLSLRTVILSHITFCIAFVVVVVKARLTSFDNRLQRQRPTWVRLLCRRFLRRPAARDARGSRRERCSRSSSRSTTS